MILKDLQSRQIGRQIAEFELSGSSLYLPAFGGPGRGSLAGTAMGALAGPQSCACDGSPGESVAGRCDRGFAIELAVPAGLACWFSVMVLDMHGWLDAPAGTCWGRRVTVILAGGTARRAGCRGKD